MPRFVICCESLIVERNAIAVQANTAEEALAMARDSEDQRHAKREDDCWFTETVGSIDRVERIDGVSHKDVDDSSDYKGSIRVNDISNLTPYFHIAVAEMMRRK